MHTIKTILGLITLTYMCAGRALTAIETKYMDVCSRYDVDTNMCFPLYYFHSSEIYKCGQNRIPSWCIELVKYNAIKNTEKNTTNAFGLHMWASIFWLPTMLISGYIIWIFDHIINHVILRSIFESRCWKSVKNTKCCISIQKAVKWVTKSIAERRNRKIKTREMREVMNYRLRIRIDERLRDGRLPGNSSSSSYSIYRPSM